MKRIFISILALGTISSSVLAQSTLDAYKFSSNDLKGTARSVGMGGAFGALGGDVTGVAINPAGIGIYTRSEIVTTLNFTNAQTQTELNDGKVDDSKFKVNFDNLAYVGVFPVNDDNVPFINFGFSYNRLKSFDRQISTRGRDLSASLTDYVGSLATTEGSTADDLFNGDSKYNPFNSGFNWLTILMYNSDLISPIASGSKQWSSTFGGGGKVNNASFLREKGYINSYDFNIGTTISNILSLGITMSLTDIDYSLYSSYNESQTNDWFSVENYQKTTGAGYQVKVGAILKPIHELRIGVAYHSPTWYNMTDYNSAIIEDPLGFIDTANPDNGGDYPYDYKINTPYEWVFSLAGVIGQKAIISADYQITDYSSMKLKDYDGYVLSENQYISKDFKAASTLRLGAEYRFTPQISGRVGYAWMQSPLEDNVKNGSEPMPAVGTQTHSILDKDTHHATWGLGYRFNSGFYTDLAFVAKFQNANYYSYSNVFNNDGSYYVQAPVTKLKSTIFSGLLTLGYRF